MCEDKITQDRNQSPAGTANPQGSAAGAAGEKGQSQFRISGAQLQSNLPNGKGRENDMEIWPSSGVFAAAVPG